MRLILLSLLSAACLPVQYGIAMAGTTALPAQSHATPAPTPTPTPDGGGASKSAGGTNIGYMSGSQLYLRCTETSPASGAFCFAYVAGVHDSVRAYEVWLRLREFCIPAGTTQSQLRDVFLDYARRHPTALNGQAASVVVAALKEKYPCIGS